MSMANSLEVRVPFLDYRVVDFAFSLPDSFKINNKNRKIILKEAFKKELPGKFVVESSSPSWPGLLVVLVEVLLSRFSFCHVSVSLGTTVLMTKS